MCDEALKGNAEEEEEEEEELQSEVLESLRKSLPLRRSIARRPLSPTEGSL